MLQDQLLIMIHIVIVFVGWVLQIKFNVKCNLGASNTKFINGFQKFVLYHPNKFKHIEKPCVKKTQQISPLPH
jgi:hypothetical protein